MNANEEWINRSLQSAKHFDEILLFIDPATKVLPHIDLSKITPPVRMVEYSDHLEVGEAYDLLIDAADDGWICTFFDDDYFDEAELKRLIDYVKNLQAKADIIHFRCHITGGMPYHQWGSSHVTISSLEFDNQLPAGSFFRKEVWRTVGGLHGTIAHDWIFWLRAAYRGFIFHYFDGCPYWFNYRRDSIYHRQVKEKAAGDLSKVKELVMRDAREDKNRSCSRFLLS